MSLRFNQPVRWIVLELGRRFTDLHVAARLYGSEVRSVSVPAGESPTQTFLEADGDPFLDVAISGAISTSTGSARCRRTSRPARRNSSRCRLRWARSSSTWPSAST